MVCGDTTCGGGDVCIQPCCGGPAPPCLELAEGEECLGSLCDTDAGTPGCFSTCKADPPYCTPPDTLLCPDENDPACTAEDGCYGDLLGGSLYCSCE